MFLVLCEIDGVVVFLCSWYRSVVAVAAVYGDDVCVTPDGRPIVARATFHARSLRARTLATNANKTQAETHRSRAAEHERAHARTHGWVVSQIMIINIVSKQCLPILMRRRRRRAFRHAFFVDCACACCACVLVSART